ncbi:MAG: PQQ-dependent sugar dehydrogenase [Anaerolineae bacterium]|nr:PQQ-dependent sugar dehydrogenase [Anaerolineae bacterium]
MNRTIKRLFLLLCLFLVGCGSQTTPTATPTSPATATAGIAVLVTLESPTESPSPTALVMAEPATATLIPTITPVITATLSLTTTPEITMTVTAGPAAVLTPTMVVTGTAAAATPVPPPPGGSVGLPPDYPGGCAPYPCADDKTGWEGRIQVPSGFTVTYFGILPGKHPTSITFGPDGWLYVATMEGQIYRLDNNGNASTYATGFTMPTGIAFQPGTSNLYVSHRASNQGIGGESRVMLIRPDGSVSTILAGLPCCYTSYHAANGIAFGPDGFGYVSVGARADHGEILEGPNAGEQDELHPLEASILRFSPDGSFVEVYARGFRNSYDIAWDGNGNLYASDNAPDYGPPEELHRVVPGGEHGYPWYDCDVCFSPPPGVTVIPPVYQFIPHSSPTGITAYLHSAIPGYYNSLFVALWSAFPGAQKVMRLNPGGGSGVNFATGFAAPIDITVAPDGSLFVADWATGIIFQIKYGG